MVIVILISGYHAWWRSISCMVYSDSDGDCDGDCDGDGDSDGDCDVAVASVRLINLFHY